MTENQKRLLLACGSAVVAALVFVTVLEVVLRVRYETWKGTLRDKLRGSYFVPSDDSRLSWENRPGFAGSGLAINRWGFRDVDSESKQKPAGTYRVAFVGDSVTFGDGVDADDLFVRRVGTAIAAFRGRRVQTMNFSVVGYDALQIEELVRARVVDFQPNLVVYVFCLNDFDFAPDELRRYFTPPRSFAWDRLTRRTIVEQGVDYHEAHFSRNRGAVFDAIRGTDRLLHERGIAFEVVTVPVFERREASFDHYPLANIHDALGRFLEDARIPTVDLLPIFRRCASLPPRAYAFDVWHMNALGHRFVALALSELGLSNAEHDRISDAGCDELRSIDPGDVTPEGARVEAELSRGNEVHLGVDHPLVLLVGFWQIERAPGGAFAWSRERSVLRLMHLPPRTRYHVTLTVADAAGLASVEIGSEGGALDTALLDGPELRVPNAVTADRYGRASVELRVRTWQPSSHGATDTRKLGIALSGATLRAGR